MKVVVIGSLGHIGKPLAKQLVEEDHTVTVISSAQEREKEIEALGATAAIGNLEDLEFLVSTFTGTDAVYAMVPPNFSVPDLIAYYRSMGSNYAQAIRQSGVKRVVYLSGMGAHLDKSTGEAVIGAHHVEGILNELSDVTITHLRPGFFYSNYYNFVDLIKDQGFIGANYGGNDKLILVAPSDIATTALEEIQTPSGERVRYVASDERTGNEMADILGGAIGKPDLEWVAFTDDQMKEGLEANGMPTHIVNNIVEIGASTRSGAIRKDYERHKPIAMGKVKLEEFAEEFAATFEKD